MNRIRKKKVERVRDLAEKASEIVLEALEILTEAKDNDFLYDICDELETIIDGG